MFVSNLTEILSNKDFPFTEWCRLQAEAASGMSETEDFEVLKRRMFAERGSVGVESEQVCRRLEIHMSLSCRRYDDNIFK